MQMCKRVHTWLASVVLSLLYVSQSAAGVQELPAKEKSTKDRATLAEELRVRISKSAEGLVAPENVGRNPVRDLELLHKLTELREFLSESQKEYATEIASDVQPYRNLKGVIQHNRERIDEFEKGILDYASVEHIQADVDHINMMCDKGVENRAPAYFRAGNDISNRTKAAKERIRALEILKPNSKELAKAKSLIEKTTAHVRETQKKLASEIIADNELPEDNYRAADRDQLLKIITETWGKQSSKKPVKVGLIGDRWERSKGFEVQNRTLYEFDRSRMQGFVVVDYDKQTHACYHIQLKRDHIDKDRLSAWLIDDPGREVEPMDLVLKSKSKK